MGYTITSAEKAPVLDENGLPLRASSVTDVLGGPLPFHADTLEVQDDGAGNVEIVGKAPGTTDVQFLQTATGTAKLHTITVTAAPFDWTLGTPVAK